MKCMNNRTAVLFPVEHRKPQTGVWTAKSKRRGSKASTNKKPKGSSNNEMKLSNPNSAKSNKSKKSLALLENASPQQHFLPTPIHHLEGMATFDKESYVHELKKGEYLVNIPLTRDQLSVMDVIEERLRLIDPLWKGRNPSDERLQNILTRYDLFERGMLDVSPSDEDILKDYECGTYPGGSFTLPLIEEIKSQFPVRTLYKKVEKCIYDDMEEFNRECIRNGTPNTHDAYFEKLETNPPLSLIHWGIVPDPASWERRKVEKKLEEQWQLDTHKPYEHHIVTENVFLLSDQSSKDSNLKSDHCSNVTTSSNNVEMKKSSAPKRAIVKTSHITAACSRTFSPTPSFDSGLFSDHIPSSPEDKSTFYRS